MNAAMGIDMENDVDLYTNDNADLLAGTVQHRLDYIMHIQDDDPLKRRNLMGATNVHISVYLRAQTSVPLRLQEQILESTQLADRLGNPAVPELYPPPRVTTRCQRVEFRPELALDLTVLDPHDDLPWDPTKPHRRARARRLLEQYSPRLPILSPTCKAFSTFNRLNTNRASDAKWNAQQETSRVHIRLAMTLCKLQLETWQRRSQSLFDMKRKMRQLTPA